jgi:hypothetical protein
MLDAFKAVNAVLVSQGIANAAPVLNALPTQYVLPAGSLQFTVTATDAEGDEVTFNGTGLPSGATFSPVTGVFSWPKAQPAGDYTFVVQPTDGVSLGASMAVKISVTTLIPVEPVVPLPPVPTAGKSGGGASGWVEVLCGLLLLLMGRFQTNPKRMVRQSSPAPACRHPAP